MKLSEARDKLQPPLVFGNPEQVAAMHFLNQVEVVARIMEEIGSECRPCRTCNGTGQHDCDCGNTHDCGDCDGSGFEDYTEEMSGFGADVLDAAIELRAEQRRAHAIPAAPSAAEAVL